MTTVAKLSLETGNITYKRSIEVTEAFLYAYDPEGDRRTPILLSKHGANGQTYADGADNVGLTNLQTQDKALFPMGYKEAEISFSVIVLGNSMKPNTTDNSEVTRAYREISEAYADVGGFQVLAELYAWNIANAKFAWRNRYISDEARVEVSFDGVKLTFDPLLLSHETPEGFDAMAAALLEGDKDDLTDFIEGLCDALAGGRFTCDVIWRAAVKPGQQLYPSQLYLCDEEKKKNEDKKDNYTKVLSSQPYYLHGKELRHATMTSEKMNNAIRTIDCWHGVAGYGAIAVNAFGGVKEDSAVLRKTKNSFYAIRKTPEKLLAGIRDAETVSDIPDDAHFFMANLVRGGVYGMKNAAKTEAAAAKKKAEEEKKKEAAAAKKAAADAKKADAAAAKKAAADAKKGAAA